MNIQMNMPGPTIAIIGGGSSGVSVAVQIIEEIRMRKMYFPDLMAGKLTIRLYEPTGRTGPGMPYYTPGDDNGDIFMLNQPAYAMSPFARDPGHFTRWLENNRPGSTEYDFAPRSVYGSYLGDTFAAAQRLARDFNMNLEVVQASVTNVGRHEDGFSLVDDGSRYSTAHSVVIATGHAKGEFLSEYSSYPYYFDCPFDIARARDVLETDKLLHESKRGVLLIGTSQTMLDALSVLHHVGYSGPIYAASRKLVMPWAFNPHTHKAYNGGKYHYQILTPEKLMSQSTWTYETLKTLFEKELAFAQERNVPTGYVLGGYDPAALMAATDDHTTWEALKTLEDHVNAVYGNPTPPQRFNLLTQYLEHGKLSLLKMDVSRAGIQARSGGFSFEIPGDGALPSRLLNVSAIFNCASQQMKTIDHDGTILSPLLKKMDRQGALLRHPGDRHAFAPGEQNWEGLYLVGPVTNSRRWGIETFRKATDEVAGHIVRNVVNYTPRVHTVKQRNLLYV